MIEHHRIFHEDVAIHYVLAGKGPPLVLLHGFPQTWHQWRPMIERLAEEYLLIMPDLRGIGVSPVPPAGFQKMRMAQDVRAVVTAAVGDQPILLAGHDMGSFVAFAYALQFEPHVDGLMLIDAPMPGTALLDRMMVHPRAWHIGFHGARDVAEMLVNGRERAYIKQFIAHRIYNPSAISAEDIDVYAAAYAAPGAMRAGFEMYRALEEDIADNRAKLAANGRLKVPVTFVGGAHSLVGTMLSESMDEIAENWSGESVERTGHWIPEEQPDIMAELLRSMRRISSPGG